VGARVCAGQHLAIASAWISLVSILAVFNISKAKDENGEEVDLDMRFFDGMVR